MYIYIYIYFKIKRINKILKKKKNYGKRYIDCKS